MDVARHGVRYCVETLTQGAGAAEVSVFEGLRLGRGDARGFFEDANGSRCDARERRLEGLRMGTQNFICARTSLLASLRSLDGS
jgi:hypothetical protein